MAKQLFFALGVLMVLIISQVIWFNELWELDKLRLQKELTSEIANITSFQSLFMSAKETKEGGHVVNMKIKDLGTSDSSDVVASNSVISNVYSSDKSLGKMAENAFMDMALQSGQIRTGFVDSVFRASYPRIDEIAYYHLTLKEKNQTIDSVSYGNKLFYTPFHIAIPLGSKNSYSFQGDIILKPSVQIRNMLFSIGITAVAIILVAIFMIFQLLQLRKKSMQLQWRERTVSGIVHDLKSPLSYVYTMLGLFETTEKDTFKQQNLHTSKIRVRFLSEKIEMLLSAGKALNSKLVLHPTPYPFVDRCKEIMEELTVIYKNKKIDFQIEAPSNFTLQADGIYFEGCVRNLLDNAVKYSPDDAKVLVTVIQQNGKTTLCFYNNGSGIEPQLRKKVFKEFYRNSETANIKGHGIGLAFTKQVVKAHDGTIYIADNPKGTEGTMFVIELPSNA